MASRMIEASKTVTSRGYRKVHNQDNINLLELSNSQHQQPTTISKHTSIDQSRN